MLNRVTEIIIIIIMVISAIFAYKQLTKMDHNYHPHSLLDDLLLFICIPAFFVNAIFSIVPAVEYGNPESITLIILQVRRSNSYKNKQINCKLIIDFTSIDPNSNDHRRSKEM